MIDDEDYLLDEEDVDLDSTPQPDEEEEEEGEEGLGNEDDTGYAKDDSLDPRMTKDEVYLSSAYDDIQMSTRKNDAKANVGQIFDANVVDAVRIIIGCDPKMVSNKLIEDKTGECFQNQGHNRIPASVYTPDVPLRSTEVDEEFGGTDDEGFNAEYTKAAREQVANFIQYLATRDLSKDSVVSRKRKQRQLPAFLIFLFSTGMYDLILNCPTLPQEYQVQVKRAFESIQKKKYDIVEALAQRYESRGRDKVAERVRKMGLAWFAHEPAELKTLSIYSDLDLTYDDIKDYREFRPKFTNASKTITQDLISDYIEVVIDNGRIYEKLKDKTRSDAIADVKQVYKDWAKENTIDTELADKIIWNKLKN